MVEPVLICTDLDRTLLPNGNQEESPQARPLFARLAALPMVSIAYISGRDKGLVLEAVDNYGIPLPDYIVADVGATIYSEVDGACRTWRSWQARLAECWQGAEHRELAALFEDLEPLRLQEPEKQSDFKLSFYAPISTDTGTLLGEMQQRLQRRGVKANLIWSVDETTDTGLLDLLPESASKLHALEFLMERERFVPERCVFAGDSGNDLPILASPVRSVLVANATAEVCRQAVAMAENEGTQDALYLARGGLLGMNGNYGAGILEGAAHFIPQLAQWLELNHDHDQPTRQSTTPDLR